MLARHPLLLISAILVLSLADPAGAQGPPWKKEAYPEDGFQVEFSGAIKVTPTKVSAETQQKIVRANQYMQDDGDTVYAVGANLNKASLAFDKGVRASFGTFKCKSTVSDTPVVVTGGRGQARELRGTDCLDGAFRVEARYFSRGLWFYQVMALFKMDGGDETAARHFLQSFALIEVEGAASTTQSVRP